MKKIFYISIALYILFSCTNESLIEPKNTVESASATKAMFVLSNHYNGDATLKVEKNPTENIIFDFGYTYDFPIAIAYNSGARITVNNHAQLIDIVVSMTDDLFINSIDFPFSINSYEEASNAIVQTTISNETDFSSIVTAANFDNDCDCNVQPQVVVCVEIQNDSQTEIISYPNACEAICDGFEEATFVSCNDDCIMENLEVVVGDCLPINNSYNLEINFEYANTGGYDGFKLYKTNNVFIGEYDLDDLPITIDFNADDNAFLAVYIQECSSLGIDWEAPNCSSCWNFVYPVDITYNGATSTVNNSEDMDVLLSDTGSTWAVIYPFDVLIDDVSRTINTENDFNEIGEWDNRCN